MESLSQILEEELENAVEVKDKKSLHRYVVLMTENMMPRKDNLDQFQLLRDDIHQNRSDILELTTAMKAGFELMEQKFDAVDKRFEAVDKRFEAVDKRFEAADKRFESIQAQMDRRFEAVDSRFETMQTQMNQRFSTQFKFMTLGFTVIVVLMSLYNFL